MTAGVPQTEWADRLAEWVGHIPSTLRAVWADRAVREAVTAFVVGVAITGVPVFLLVQRWLEQR